MAAAQDPKGYYKLFGLEPGASLDEVKKKHKQLQIKYHPTGPGRREERNTPEYKKMTEEQRMAREKELDEAVDAGDAK